MELARLLNRPGDMREPGASCLDEATLAAVVQGDLPDSSQVEVEAHLADCDWCIRRVGLLSSLQEEARGEPPPRAVLDRAEALVAVTERRLLTPRYLAAAAALLALISGGTGWRLAEMRDQTPQVRESERVIDERMGVEVLAPVQTTVLLDPDRQIRWSSVADSTSYTVTVTLADGRLVWEHDTEATEIHVPPEIALISGETYFLQVRAHLLDGRSLRSGHLELRIATD